MSYVPVSLCLRRRSKRRIHMAKRNTTKPEQTAAKPTKRKPIPDHIKEALLIEQGYKCGNPRCWTILKSAILEDHHIEYVSEGGGNEPSNLLALCPTCHTMHHHGMISRDAIRHWKKLIVALDGPSDREAWIYSCSYTSYHPPKSGGSIRWTAFFNSQV